MSETPNAKVETVPAPVEVPAAAPSAPVWAVKQDREFPMPTAGEYMAAFHIGGETWRNVNAAYKQNVAKNLPDALELQAHGLLGDVKRLGRCGNRPLFIQGAEHAKVVEFKFLDHERPKLRR